MIRIFVSLLTGAMLTVGCSGGGDRDGGPQDTRTIARADGHVVTYNYPPRRVGVFAYGAGDTMIALGLEDRIAVVLTPEESEPGPGDVDIVPDEINRSGSAERFAEYLASADLDLVMLNLNIGTGETPLVRLLDEAGLPVLCCELTDVRTLDDVYEYILGLGEIFGVESRANELVDSLKSRAAAVGKTDVTVMIFVTDRLFAAQGALISDVFRHLGATVLPPAVAPDIQTVLADAEDVATINPDCVFGSQAWLELLDLAAWEEVPAIRDGRLYSTAPGGDVAGPELFDVMEQAASDLADCASRLTR